MPKMKTKKALAKRVKKTAGGKLKRSQAYMNHFAPNKTKKQRRHLKKSSLVSKSDYKPIKLLLQG